MGEPTAAEAATSERDILLATKLNVPGLRPDLVPRPRLAQRLDEGGRRGLVLACAPAGYGKTVLLAAGQSNQAIASQLVVTLDTVKKHVSHVLGKLGAANRTEAVTRARELGLIS